MNLTNQYKLFIKLINPPLPYPVNRRTQGNRRLERSEKGLDHTMLYVNEVKTSMKIETLVLI